ncbi:MAG TPA: 4-alpha-glucanotransferase [Lachnospiraceae bacterium]|nr:4-alpha-glucanotransferase [Lachnospiraceae bacterium]
MRKSGVLLPVSSIPSKYGIGTISKKAYEFVDFLRKAGQSYWQILPLGPTGYGDSPYQSFSTFAGNPYFIDLEDLVEKGWISKKICSSYDFGKDSRYIDYEKMYISRFKVLKKAFLNSNIESDRKYQSYIKTNDFWLDNYALYMAVKNSFQGKSWVEWDEDIKLRKEAAIEEYSTKYKEDISFYKFQQYIFHKQWIELKNYANKNKVEIIGDIPIYVAFDSADTWSNPELFQLDANCNPISVAGCPPDAFSSTGQLWGNPLYNWEYHKKTNYEWWFKRISFCYEIYDVVRIDHFRGFDEYYAIPYGNPTAEFGKWEKGPGYEFFKVMKEQLGELAVIAEDLGFLTPSVIELVKKTGYPGMKILQFAFDSREDSDYLPHNYEKNCVVYTGTHDNDTTRGWYKTFAKEKRKFAKEYLDIHTNKDIQMKFVRAALSSVADTAIIPLQDYLGRGSESRINTPATLGDNWKWRMTDGQFTDELAKKMYDLNKLFGRI